MLIRSTAFAPGEENLMYQSFDRPSASSGPSEVVVSSKGMASGFQALARAFARSQASLALMDAPLPVLPAVQAACIWAAALAETAVRSTRTRPRIFLTRPPFGVCPDSSPRNTKREADPNLPPCDPGLPQTCFGPGR